MGYRIKKRKNKDYDYLCSSLSIEIHHLSDLGGIRTPDPRLRRALLYPAELLNHP